MNHSTFYPLAVFVHLLGVMALVALAGLEWATLQRLRREPGPAQVTAALSSFGKGQKLVSLGVPLLLSSGLYLVWAAWAWTTPWILAGMVSMVMLGILGGKVTGRHVGALTASKGEDLEAHLPAMWSSFTIRVAVLVAAVFLMCANRASWVRPSRSSSRSLPGCCWHVRWRPPQWRATPD